MYHNKVGLSILKNGHNSLPSQYFTKVSRLGFFPLKKAGVLIYKYFVFHQAYYDRMYTDNLLMLL